MIVLKKAPAGYIGQFVTNFPVEKLGAKDRHVWLRCTGEWKPTPEEAVKAALKCSKKEIKRLDNKILKLQNEIAELTAIRNNLAEEHPVIDNEEFEKNSTYY